MHKVEYYTAKKINKLQQHASTFMNLTKIMLSEKHQTQRSTHCSAVQLYKVQQQAPINVVRSWDSSYIQGGMG